MTTLVTDKIFGAILDWNVAQALGYTKQKDGEILFNGEEIVDPCYSNFSPSNLWIQAGPLIEKHNITIAPVKDDIGWPNGEGLGWIAEIIKDNGLNVHASGKTPLLAAMRCLVKSEFGETFYFTAPDDEVLLYLLHDPDPIHEPDNEMATKKIKP